MRAEVKGAQRKASKRRTHAQEASPGQQARVAQAAGASLVTPVSACPGSALPVAAMLRSPAICAEGLCSGGHF